MRDSCGRTIDYLRLSVTDLCNYRCQYCMPPEGVEKRLHSDILSIEELAEIAAAAVRCGVKKTRLTGGEPLVRRGLPDLCRMLRAIPGLAELCLTTNGSLLPQLARPLRDAGVDRLNISLDTPVYYICRRVLADNTPVLFSTDIVPCSLFGTTRTDGIDFTRPIFNILDEACGIQVSSTITHLRAAMGDPAVRHALALQRDQALLELSETCYSRLCRPVLRCRTFYTDFFDFALVRKLV